MIHHFRAEGTDAALDFDIEVAPHKRVYCFIGENGAGKTTLLENMARALLIGHTMLQNVEASVRFSGLFFENGVGTPLSPLTFHVPRALSVDGAVLRWGGVIPAKLHSFSIGVPWSVDRPVIMLGARDRGFTENINTDRVKLLGDRPSRFVQAYLRTYMAAMRQKVEVESLAEWFAARVLIHPSVSRADDRSFEVETVLHLLEEIDPQFAGVSERDESRALRHVQYIDGKLLLRDVPFERLPSGVIAIVKLFQEILSGLAGWSAMSGERDLANQDAIVLIDEIEAHLHPVWQAKVLPLLKRFFPRATFYVATHSPLIAATTAEGEAYELLRNGRRVTARPLGNPGAWYLADVYEQAFHVTLSPSSTDALAEDLVQFSVRVKDHVRTKDPALREAAITLYNRITPSMPGSDPRRASLDSLRRMLG